MRSSQVPATTVWAARAAIGTEQNAKWNTSCLSGDEIGCTVPKHD